MENSSKALLIAAAVLIVILLIAFSVKIFNSPQEVQQQATDVGMSISQKATDATEALSSSFDIDRELTSGEVNSNPNEEIQDSTTSSTDWHITNVQELKEFANLVNNGNDFKGITVYLDNDLDLNNENWVPIGNYDNHFKGTFDGQNHYISRINVNGERGYSGLFGVANVIKNLTLKDSVIKSNKICVGGIAGGVLSYIDNCISKNNEIVGKKYVGGIVGVAVANSRIINCKNTSKVETILSAEEMDEDINEYGCRTGGIVGSIKDGTTIIGCINEGDVTGNRHRIGGIVGDTGTQQVFITNCVNKGNITLQPYDNEETYVGGIVGLIPTDSQDPSSNTNESNRVTISYCYNEGKIEGISAVGGIAGTMAQYMSLIEKCYNKGDIIATKTAGGICGGMGRSSQIVNCYNIGNVYGNNRCGGIASSSYRSTNPNGGIINCYNLGKINGVDNTNITIGNGLGNKAEILGEWIDNEAELINCIINRNEIKTNFINNTGNNVWEIKPGINNGYPVLSGMSN